MKAIAFLILLGVVILSFTLMKVESFVDKSGSAPKQATKSKAQAQAKQAQPQAQPQAILTATPGRPPTARSDATTQDRYQDYQFKGREGDVKETPYATAPINDIDDYETQLVDQVSGWRKMNDRTAKELTRRTPLHPDWSDLPQDNDQFQVKRQDFVDGIYTAPQPDDAAFKMLEGGDIQPPNQDQIDTDEARLLATYEPKHSAGLTKYSIEDAKDFIKRYYDASDKVPEIVEDPKYPNVYQIVGVQDKHPKITWEPAPAAPDATEYIGEETIRVPQVAVERADPFFFGQGKGYKSWTPGLERMFAPTYAKSSWY